LGSKELVAAVLDDYTTAPITDAERALFALIAKVVADSTSISHEDLDRARAAGWSDEALYDAITVCALFQFYNTWIDATGVSDMPGVAYDISGKRLAEKGYAYAEEPVPEAAHA
jgi:alkylhydroperoxidase family enzyme